MNDAETERFDRKIATSDAAYEHSAYMSCALAFASPGARTTLLASADASLDMLADGTLDLGAL